MQDSPLAQWAGYGGVVLVVALCGGTAYATLRAPMRGRIIRLSPKTMAILCMLAALPWLIVHFALKHFSISVHSTGDLIGVLALALLAFTLLVLLPLVVTLCILVWMFARSGR